MPPPATLGTSGYSTLPPVTQTRAPGLEWGGRTPPGTNSLVRPGTAAQELSDGERPLAPIVTFRSIVPRGPIRERHREGIELAKARGAYRGRKRSLSDDQVAELRRRVEDGVPKAVLARELGVSRETLYQALRTASGSAGAGQGPSVAKPSAEVSV